MYMPPVINVGMFSNPPPGDIQLIARVKNADRNKINIAAQKLNMTQAQFLRSALVGVAEAVLREAVSAESVTEETAA